MPSPDGPTETHKVVVARRLLKDYKPHQGLFPRAHIPTQRDAARQKLAAFLEPEAAQH